MEWSLQPGYMWQSEQIHAISGFCDPVFPTGCLSKSAAFYIYYVLINLGENQYCVWPGHCLRSDEEEPMPWITSPRGENFRRQLPRFDFGWYTFSALFAFWSNGNQKIFTTKTFISRNGYSARPSKSTSTNSKIMPRFPVQMERPIYDYAKTLEKSSKMVFFFFLFCSEEKGRGGKIEALRKCEINEKRHEEESKLRWANPRESNDNCCANAKSGPSRREYKQYRGNCEQICVEMEWKRSNNIAAECYNVAQYTII